MASLVDGVGRVLVAIRANGRDYLVILANTLQAVAPNMMDMHRIRAASHAGKLRNPAVEALVNSGLGFALALYGGSGEHYAASLWDRRKR